MGRKRILIAETNKPQDKFIKDALIKNGVNVEILDEEPINSEEMKEIILRLEPDIVITNEKKIDKPASDIIKEIQGSRSIKQPIFILVSGYGAEDMNYVLTEKEIDVCTITKPYNFDNLANCIKTIVNQSISNIEVEDDFYKKWEEKYYNKRFIEIEKYLTEEDFDLFNKLGIEVEKKIYTEYEFGLLNMDLLAYYDDPEMDLSDEEKKFQKSLEGTNVSREEYNEVLNRVQKINENF